MGEMNTMPCLDCGKRHPATHAEAIGAASQPMRRCPNVGKSYGTSVYTGIAEDIDMPIIRTGNTNIEDVDNQT